MAKADGHGHYAGQSAATVYPVLRENIKTGRIGRRIHALRSGERATMCGQSIFIDRADVQFSVEEPSTPITCPDCRKALDA